MTLQEIGQAEIVSKLCASLFLLFVTSFVPFFLVSFFLHSCLPSLHLKSPQHLDGIVKCSNSVLKLTIWSVFGSLGQPWRFRRQRPTYFATLSRLRRQRPMYFATFSCLPPHLLGLSWGGPHGRPKMLRFSTETSHLEPVWKPRPAMAFPTIETHVFCDTFPSPTIETHVFCHKAD